MSDPRLLHFTLARELEALWRRARRAKLAEAGIEVRRPQHQWPEPPEREPTDQERAQAIADVAALEQYEIGSDD
jgi:hypothetical protein